MTAVIDACVLYPTVLREIVIGTARADLIRPKWSDRLLEEWFRTAARHGGQADEAIARGEAARLNAEFPGAMTRADPLREAQLWLPDPGDIHVLTTAVTARAQMIVTLNLRDFPCSELIAHDLGAIHPDAMLYGLWLDHPDPVTRIVNQVHTRAAALFGQPLALKPLLKRARLPRLAKALAA